MTRCNCGSYAINPTNHGRDGSDSNLCDVCYWRKRAERKPMTRDQVDDLAEDGVFLRSVYEIVQEVEAFHGIKDTP